MFEGWTSSLLLQGNVRCSSTEPCAFFSRWVVYPQRDASSTRQTQEGTQPSKMDTRALLKDTGLSCRAAILVDGFTEVQSGAWQADLVWSTGGSGAGPESYPGGCWSLDVMPDQEGLLITAQSET